MINQKSLFAYSDVADTLDRAIAAERGISVKFETPGLATRFRQRCYILISKLRQSSLTIYKFGEPNHGRTPYDELIISAPRDGGWLDIRKGALQMEVREL